jgi:hypothetical protein
MDLEGNCVDSCGDKMFVKATTHLSMCKPCPEGCSACESNTECTGTPDRGYFELDGIAVKCADKHCLHCDAEACLECKVGLFINPEDGACVNTCGLGKFAGDDSVCAECQEGCVSCENADTCDECERGFQVSSEGACEACGDENCAHCENNRCLKCKTDFFSS